MRKLLIGLLGFATLGFGALSAPQAEAQPYYGYRPVVEYRSGPVLVRHDRGRPHYGRRVYRPAPAYRPVPVARRCWVEPRRVWNGYRWVRRGVEVCRTVRRPGYRW
ncbi:hypothetical protein [Microvirga guangxiensis]|uniref:YXWGXW repeat-containing protein n=1 Tax=Microvirga guangxiensis TaxID=549386 RepID=A0A1G5JN05_9HYPH|nr:hypothetical protein [Microvirga guangxiensis]SCY89753.1 hypothetical protein SAMN02927923_02763 [Microvirga guangxiensis]